MSKPLELPASKPSLFARLIGRAMRLAKFGPHKEARKQNRPKALARRPTQVPRHLNKDLGLQINEHRKSYWEHW